MFPPIPSWEEIHPLVVHFPIALLMVAPVFVLLGIFSRKAATPFRVSALVLMVLGTSAVFTAVASGEAAEDGAERAGAPEAVVARHEDLAEQTRLAFVALTVVFAGLTAAPLILKRRNAAPALVAANAVFLLLYLGGTTVLARTAHEGGRLVHEFGAKAATSAAPELSSTPIPGRGLSEFDSD